MRPRACIAGLLLGLSACAHIPSAARIEVDGQWIEIGRQPDRGGLAIAGRWSFSPDCAAPPAAEPGAATAPPDEIALTGQDGPPLRLCRCR